MIERVAVKILLVLVCRCALGQHIESLGASNGTDSILHSCEGG